MGLFEVLEGFFWMVVRFCNVFEGYFGIIWDPLRLWKDFLGWLRDFENVAEGSLGII